MGGTEWRHLYLNSNLKKKGKLKPKKKKGNLQVKTEHFQKKLLDGLNKKWRTRKGLIKLKTHQ